jgi:hypothetical protein
MDTVIVDILLAAGITAISLWLAYLGVSVTLHPPTEKEQVSLKRRFLILGFVAVGLTIFQGIRAGIAQKELLEAIHNNPAKIEVNVPQSPPPNVTVNPVPAQKHAHVTFKGMVPTNGYPLRPFHQGQEPKINTEIENYDDIPVMDTKMAGRVVVSPVAYIDGVFKKYRNTLKPSGGNGTLSFGNTSYRTFSGSPLTDDDVIGLDKGEKALCTIEIIQWNDETGYYETHFSQCFAVQPTGELSMLLTPENNKEIKLKAK